MSPAMVSGFFSVFIFGILVALLGSAKLKLAPRIGADDEQFGRIVAVFQWTMVVMAIAGGIALDRFGHGIIIPLGIVLSALAILLISRSRTISAVMMSCVVLGIGGQFVNLGGNTLLPELFADPSAGSNLGNTFFGLGAFLIPVLTAYLFQKIGFEKALLIVSLIVFVPVFFTFAADFPGVGGSFSLSMAAGLLGNVITWLAALTLFCYIGLEISMATWITTYAAQLGAEEASASRMLSLFFIAMMLSRLAVGLQHHVTGVDPTPVGGYLLMTAALIAALAITFMMRTDSLSVAHLAVILTGAVFGPIFPTTVGVTFQHFEPSQWGTLFGVIFAVGLMGASILPAWIGKLARGASVRGALNILRVTAIALAIVSALLGWA